MLVHKAFRYRVYPSASQVERLSKWADALRFLWNLAHEQRILCLARSTKIYLSAFDQQKEMTDLRAELPWLADVPRNVSAELLKRLDTSWRRFFDKTNKHPHWKRKNVDSVSFCETHPKIWRLDDKGLRFPKLGYLRIVTHRPLEGSPKSCTLSCETGQWHVSILCHIDKPDPTPRVVPVVALDRGVINAVADSDGNIIESPRFYKRSMKRLARAQRVMCRRKKGSKNREKAKKRVAKLHQKVRRQRSHFVHVLSARYAKSHGTVVVENLNIEGMVRAHSGLARGILDAGWGQLARYLRYKLEWSGGRLVEVPAAYSSQTCSSCGAVDKKSRRSQSRFACTGCGHEAHADLNAARVLKSRANRSALPVDGVSPKDPSRSRKRKRLRSEALFL